MLSLVLLTTAAGLPTATGQQTPPLTEVELDPGSDVSASAPGPYREAPTVLPMPRTHGVGHLVPDVQLDLLGGERVSLSHCIFLEKEIFRADKMFLSMELLGR